VVEKPFTTECTESTKKTRKKTQKKTETIQISVSFDQRKAFNNKVSAVKIEIVFCAAFS